MLSRIAGGRTDLVLDHLEAGGAPDAVDADGVSLLAWCAYYGDVSTMKALLARGADLASLGANLDLNGAAFHGHWRLTRFLIERGADPDFALADTGETALHAALARPGGPAQDRVVEVLLAAGADPNRVTHPGAVTGAYMRDVRTRGETPLHRAAAQADEGTLRRLLDAGARPDLRDANGDSPLTWASWALRPAPILRLLCFGPFSIHPDSAAMAETLLGRP